MRFKPAAAHRCAGRPLLVPVRSGGRQRAGGRAERPSCDQPQEQGSVSALVIGMTTVLLLIITVLTAITSLHIERQRLYALADAASQAAADSYAASSAIGSGADPSLAGERASSAASRVVASSDEVARVEVIQVNPDSALVRVTGRARPPLIGFFVPEGISVSVESSARIRER